MPNQPYECNKSQEQDSALNIIEKYKFHPCIKLIKSKNEGLSSSFSFRFATIKEVEKSISILDPKKASQRHLHKYFKNKYRFLCKLCVQ